MTQNTDRALACGSHDAVRDERRERIAWLDKEIPHLEHDIRRQEHSTTWSDILLAWLNRMRKLLVEYEVERERLTEAQP